MTERKKRESVLEGHLHIYNNSEVMEEHEQCLVHALTSKKKGLSEAVTKDNETGWLPSALCCCVSLNTLQTAAPRRDCSSLADAHQFSSSPFPRCENKHASSRE